MNKIREKVLTVLNHALIDLDTIDKLTDRHGYHRFNLLRGELTELKTELDRIESEKQDYWKTLASACERTRTLPEAYEMIESEKPGEDTNCPSCGCAMNKDWNGHHSAADCKILQFAERYYQSRMKEKKEV